MAKISTYAPDTAPSLTDVVITVDVETGLNKKVTLQDIAEAASPVVLAEYASDGGYTALVNTPGTISSKGNRSYDLVFSGVDLTGILSEGAKLRITRSVSAPTQCTDLESGSSQYWSKTSPTGISFTTTFTCSAWIKLESYVAGGIIARRNADTEGWSLSLNVDGRITLGALRIAANNKSISSYQSVPLNQWVHVAATMDVAVGDTSAQKIWIDGAEVTRSYTLTGTCAALVQGTTALVVGATKSAGTEPFDGKIAQASVHSAQLTVAQIRTMMTETISSSSPSIVSGFTFNGSVTDVNTTNANNLTASGSAGYTSDTPFGNYVGGLFEYGIVSSEPVFSTDTTVTVQVPEGCAIPESGGVALVEYSRDGAPYKFPRERARFNLLALYKAASTVQTATAATWYNLDGRKLEVMTGAWELSYDTVIRQVNSSAGVAMQQSALSTSSSAPSDGRLVSGTVGRTSTTSSQDFPLSRNKAVPQAPATTYYLLAATQTGAGTISLSHLDSLDEGNTVILAEFAYI